MDDKLIRDELKKLVQNKITITTDDSNYLININNVSLSVPIISSQQVRKNNITNR